MNQVIDLIRGKLYYFFIDSKSIEIVLLYDYNSHTK